MSLTPNVRSRYLSIKIIIAWIFLIFGIYHLPFTMQCHDRIQRPAPATNLNISLIVAYRGELYEQFAPMSRETKEIYAKMHGYTYLEANHYLSDQMNWGERSSVRTKVLFDYLPDYDW